MEHRPFISVIIPVWNGARYLDACLNSILRQSWQHFEIIIVDDGSRDATWNMLMHWKKQDRESRFCRIFIFRSGKPWRQAKIRTP